MAKSTDPNDLIEVPAPLGGFDSSSAYDDQRRRTTPVALNSRPYDCRARRRRVSRRSGQSKYCTEQIANASGQCLFSMVVARDLAVPPGTLLSKGATGTTAAFYEKVAGAATAVGGTISGVQTLGCIDNNGDFYEASVTTGGAQIEIKKISPSDGATAWTADLTVTGTGTGAKLWGLGAIEGVVYVWIIDIDVPGLYRFDASDGSALGPSAWITSNDGMVSATATAVRSYQCLAIGGGLLGLVGGKANKLILQQINCSTGAITHEYTLQDPFVSYQSRIVADQGGNYYVLTNASNGGVNKLFKVTWGGVFPATFNSGTPLVSANGTATDIAYEPTTFAIGVVGTAVFAGVAGAGADDSYQQIAAVEGTIAAHGKPLDAPAGSAVATWLAVCADGLGNMRLRRSVGASSFDLASITANGATTNWSVKTTLGTTTQFLWLQCTGSNLTPLPATSIPGRVVRRIAVAGGSLYSYTTTSKALLDSNFVSAGAPQIFATLLSNIVYFADGISYRTYNGSTNASGTLTASAGSLPADSNGGKCRLNCTWRGRLVWSGLPGDPHNWFMSKQFDATNYDYAPSPALATQAVAGSNCLAGLCPDKVKALVPLNDDVLAFLCDHSIWKLTGDPADGGRFDLVSSISGGAWGRAFCTDADGTLYFLGTRGQLFRWTGTGKPMPIHGPVASELYDIMQAGNSINMVWDDFYSGFHLFVTPFDPSQATTHYWWDKGDDVFSPFKPQTSAFSWWQDVYGNLNHNPAAVDVFDADDPDDRRILLFGRDGFIRCLDDQAIDDDGTPIESSVYFGPIVNTKRLAFTIKDLQIHLNQTSGSASFKLHQGESVEAARNNGSTRTGTVTGGRNHSQEVRRRQHALFVELCSNESTVPWSVERMDAILEIHPAGPAQRIFYKSTPATDEQAPAPDPEPTPGTAFTPSLLSPLPTLWLLADDVSLAALANNAEITAWINRGSAGGTFANSDTGLGPKFKTNSLHTTLPVASFNGLAFPDGQSMVGYQIGAYIGAANNTIFIVAKGASDVANESRAFITDAADFNFIYQHSDGSVGYGVWDGGAKTAQASGALSTYEVMTAWHGSGVIGMRVNGGIDTTTVCGSAQNTSGLTYLGRWDGTGFLVCSIAEIIAFNVELTNDEKQLVEGYLAHKWWGAGALNTLVSNHPYKTTPPTV